VHRDVKPDNVWLAADGSAGLGDFGIAMVAGDPPGSAGGLWCGGHGADSMP
jgi:serine/threonine protein kinase